MAEIIRLNKVDLYSNGNRVKLPTGETIITRQKRVYVQSPNDRLHKVVDGETWDSIAFDKYGDSKYWHYLADINEIFNPFDPLPIGEDIIIPDIDNY